MKCAKQRAPGLNRRCVLAGFAATALTACTGAIETPVLTLPKTAQDPLAHIRLSATAGGDEWARHLHQTGSSKGPCVLALSGGGEDGAFGAGALAGWSTTGKRPQFDIVTGVSTGALIAPFAFLGADYDDDLRRVFTGHDADDIMTFKPLHVLFSDALYDTTPLANLIAEFTPPRFMRAVAKRHIAGARLFVVTSDLDRAQASVWDMGEIAKLGQYDLFRAIMRASAALPGMFSPVELRYAVDDVTYSETHIDGGVHMQFLAVPEYAYLSPNKKASGGEMYLLINNTLDPAPVAVSRSALGISQQALTTTGRATAQAGVTATQMFARANGINLSVASIDADAGIVYDASDRFSSPYMIALYQHGLARGKDHSLWSK
ncbi:MAG: patatin-like phospholipase family protein [Sulfitobacter sp.]